MVDTNGKRVKLFRRQEDMQIVNERIAFRARAETAEAELATVVGFVEKIARLVDAADRMFVTPIPLATEAKNLLATLPASARALLDKHEQELEQAISTGSMLTFSQVADSITSSGRFGYTDENDPRFKVNTLLDEVRRLRELVKELEGK